MLISYEPNTYYDLYFYLDAYGGFKWRDTDGGHTKPYICESAVVVTPGTPANCDGGSGSGGSSTSPCTVTIPTCPNSYTMFDGGCYKYVDNSVVRSVAATNCHASENGWLATLNTNAKLGLVDFFGITDYVYFGLQKTGGCTTSGCDGKLAWDTCTGIGCVPSVGGYTLNMMRLVCICLFRYSCCIYL